MPAGVLGRAICPRACAVCKETMASGELRVSVKPQGQKNGKSSSGDEPGGVSHTFYHIRCYPENPSHLCGFRLLSKDEQALVASMHPCGFTAAQKLTKGKGPQKRVSKQKKTSTLGLGRKHLMEKTNAGPTASEPSNAQEPPVTSDFMAVGSFRFNDRNSKANNKEKVWVGASPFYASRSATITATATPAVTVAKPQRKTKEKLKKKLAVSMPRTSACTTNNKTTTTDSRNINRSTVPDIDDPMTGVATPQVQAHPQRGDVPCNVEMSQSQTTTMQPPPASQKQPHCGNVLSTPVAESSSSIVLNTPVAGGVPCTTSLPVAPPRPNTLKRSFTDLPPRKPLVFEVEQDSTHVSRAGNLFKARRTYDYESNLHPDTHSSAFLAARREDDDRLATAATLISLCAM